MGSAHAPKMPSLEARHHGGQVEQEDTHDVGAVELDGKKYQKVVSPCRAVQGTTNLVENNGGTFALPLSFLLLPDLDQLLEIFAVDNLPWKNIARVQPPLNRKAARGKRCD